MSEVERLRARVVELEAALAAERAAHKRALLDVIAQARLIEHMIAERMPAWPTVQ